MDDVSEIWLVILIVFAIIFIICGSFFFGRYMGECDINERYYPKTGIVQYIDKDVSNGLLLIEDNFGMRWLWDGADGWQEGDIVSMIMDNKKTPKMKDDEIVTIEYDGHID